MSTDVEAQVLAKVLSFEAYVANKKAEGETPFMSTPTREEIEARLGATEARVDSRLANFEKTMTESLTAMRLEIGSLHTAVVKEMAEVKHSVAEVKGSLDGLKTVQNFTVALIGIAIAAAALWVAYLQLNQQPIASAPVQTSAPAPQLQQNAPRPAAPAPKE